MGTTIMKRIVITGAFLLSSLVSLNSFAAAPPTPEEAAAAAVKTRQSVFQVLSFSNGVLGAMARGGTFDAAAAIKATERVEMMAGLIPEVFANDTTAVNHGGATTRASDTIWASKADFDMLAADLAAGAVAAREILNARGAEGVRDAVGAIGPKCGACHDRFRLE